MVKEIYSKSVQCPHCGKETEITNEHANWCTKCGKPIPFPKEGESTEDWIKRAKT